MWDNGTSMVVIYRAAGCAPWRRWKCAPDAWRAEEWSKERCRRTGDRFTLVPVAQELDVRSVRATARGAVVERVDEPVARQWRQRVGHMVPKRAG